LSTDRYKEAGVDIDAGAALVDRIGPAVRSTMRPEVLGGLGHFGAMWQIPAGRFEDLVLVSGTDGVGTKLKVAQRAGVHDTIGIDLVAMCVNDVLCTGAEPFFFLDYFATGRLDVGVGAAVVEGIAEGCRQAGCSLVGGETAEMPGVYDDGVYDLAGFCVGGVERAALLDGSRVQAGDVLIGIASSGLHSNGYSLVRHIVFGEQGLAHDSLLPGTDQTVADILLTPTRIYARSVLPLVSEGLIGALCHVTGGGLPENLPRVLPANTAARVDRSAWQLPPVFAYLQEAGKLHDRDLFRTFNCGVGMVAAVRPQDADSVVAALQTAGEQAFLLGTIEPHDGAPEVRWA
jgi:phosphoribosylformylglycinamidine cyclo-ligase